jgi:hypothetical protein
MHKHILLALGLIGASGAAAFGFGDEPARATTSSKPATEKVVEQPASLPAGHPPIEREASAAPSAEIIAGVVVEVLPVERYSYLRLKREDGEVWAAVPKTSIAVGQRIRIAEALPMRDFASKSLGRTFALIYFGTVDGAGAHP